MIRLAALAAVVVLTGCQPMTPDQAASHAMKHPANGVEVIQDSARGVTCWVFASGHAGGISCIPDWQLQGGAK